MFTHSFWILTHSASTGNIGKNWLVGKNLSPNEKTLYVSWEQQKKKLKKCFSINSGQAMTKCQFSLNSMRFSSPLNYSTCYFLKQLMPTFLNKSQSQSPMQLNAVREKINNKAEQKIKTTKTIILIPYLKIQLLSQRRVILEEKSM